MFQLTRLQDENESLIGKYSKNAQELQDEAIDLPNTVEVRIIDLPSHLPNHFTSIQFRFIVSTCHMTSLTMLPFITRRIMHACCVCMALIMSAKKLSTFLKIILDCYNN